MTPPDAAMARAPAVSVIVVSRHRARALRRCLQALHQQDHPRMEVIVVADPEGLAVAAGLTVKSVPFDIPNIAQARNAGLAVAAGDLVAFIDDDAVAEPTWASRLCAPFADPAVAAAGGYVRGRNGISYQWRGRMVDALGQHTPLDVPPQGAVIAGEPGRGVRTEGTNCAFRREVLAEMGGFDPAYRFYLDDTDLNLRMAARGLLTAIVPDAQVHHGFFAGPYRRADRVPLSLHEIGASSAVFWRVHADPDTDEAADNLRRDQRARLLRHMVTGALEPRDIAPLMAGLGGRSGRGQRPRTDAFGTDSCWNRAFLAPGHRAPPRSGDRRAGLAGPRPAQTREGGGRGGRYRDASADLPHGAPASRPLRRWLLGTARRSVRARRPRRPRASGCAVPASGAGGDRPDRQFPTRGPDRLTRRH